MTGQGASSQRLATRALSTAPAMETDGNRPQRRPPTCHRCGAHTWWCDPICQPKAPGIAALDIDDRNNRVKIGLNDPEIMSSIEHRLTGLGVPHEAVIVDVSNRIREADELLDPHRPLKGGLGRYHRPSNRKASLARPRRPLSARHSAPLRETSLYLRKRQIVSCCGGDGGAQPPRKEVDGVGGRAHYLGVGQGWEAA